MANRLAVGPIGPPNPKDTRWVQLQNQHGDKPAIWAWGSYIVAWMPYEVVVRRRGWGDFDHDYAWALLVSLGVAEHPTRASG